MSIFLPKPRSGPRTTTSEKLKAYIPSFIAFQSPSFKTRHSFLAQHELLAWAEFILHEKSMGIVYGNDLDAVPQLTSAPVLGSHYMSRQMARRRLMVPKQQLEE
jgi:hypothetical protein